MIEDELNDTVADVVKEIKSSDPDMAAELYNSAMKVLDGTAIERRATTATVMLTVSTIVAAVVDKIVFSESAERDTDEGMLEAAVVYSRAIGDIAEDLAVNYAAAKLKIRHKRVN